MRLTILGSGSQGNVMHVDAQGTRILVDAGLSLAKLEERAAQMSIDLCLVDAIILTHAHGDHVGYTKAYAREFGCPIYLTEATQRRVRIPAPATARVFGASAPFSIGALEIMPCVIPHDAPQVGLVFSDGAHKAALVTDLGHVPEHLVKHLDDVQTLLIESNYDAQMLANGPYPTWLKARVASKVGHLDNRDTATLLRALSPKLRTVVLMHLSQKNNSEALARTAAEEALAGSSANLLLASQEEPMLIDVAATLN